MRAHDHAGGWVIVRPTSIWGPWGGAPYRDFFLSLARGTYVHPAHEAVRKHYGYVGNIVHQLDRLLTAPAERVEGRTFYLADPDPIDVWTFAGAIRRALGLPPPRSGPGRADAAHRVGRRRGEGERARRAAAHVGPAAAPQDRHAVRSGRGATTSWARSPSRAGGIDRTIAHLWDQGDLDGSAPARALGATCLRRGRRPVPLGPGSRARSIHSRRNDGHDRAGDGGRPRGADALVGTSGAEAARPCPGRPAPRAEPVPAPASRPRARSSCPSRPTSPPSDEFVRRRGSRGSPPRRAPGRRCWRRRGRSATSAAPDCLRDRAEHRPRRLRRQPHDARPRRGPGASPSEPARASRSTTHLEPFRLPYGELEARDGRVVDYREKPEIRMLVSSAVSVLGPAALAAAAERPRSASSTSSTCSGAATRSWPSSGTRPRGST